MLIRNAVVDGRATELRLMHGRVQEMGAGLAKGLYEAELDLMGDELRVCAAEELPPRYRRRIVAEHGPVHIMPGAPEPLARWRGGRLIGFVDSHSAD
ncbi:MAG: hypothetical protein IJ343_13240 [Clostridia bacterium]|nr:hypothetical protein [Clostridia bacterium]